MHKSPTLFAGLLCFSFFACQSRAARQEVADADTKQDSAVERPIPLSFFDSVYLQFPLTRQQIEAHTSFDSLYFTGSNSNAIFTGDTLIRFAHGVTGVVLVYDDRSVSYSKYLVTFLPDGRSADRKEIMQSNDRDGLRNYSYLDYQYTKDSLFVVTEYHMPEGADSVVSETSTKWRVSRSGKIVDVRETTN